MVSVEFRVGDAVLQLVVGDITDVEADAIVNAANRFGKKRRDGDNLDLVAEFHWLGLNRIGN